MVTCRHRADRLLKRRHYGYVEQNAGLLALEGERSVPNVLFAHSYDVATRLADLQQELIRQPRARADRVVVLELAAFVRLPRMMPIRFDRDQLHPGQGILTISLFWLLPLRTASISSQILISTGKRTKIWAVDGFWLI